LLIRILQKKIKIKIERTFLGFRNWYNSVIKTRVVNFFNTQVFWCKKGFRIEVFVLLSARLSPTVLT
jgi:hypothetical protein